MSCMACSYPVRGKQCNCHRVIPDREGKEKPVEGIACDLRRSCWEAFAWSPNNEGYKRGYVSVTSAQEIFRI